MKVVLKIEGICKNMNEMELGAFPKKNKIPIEIIMSVRLRLTWSWLSFLRISFRALAIVSLSCILVTVPVTDIASATRV